MCHINLECPLRRGTSYPTSEMILTCVALYDKYQYLIWGQMTGTTFKLLHSSLINLLKFLDRAIFWVRNSVLIYMYIYICVNSLYEFCYRSYIQRECHSVLARLHPITFYRGMRGSWSECHFVFSLVYQLCLALWSQPNARMLVTLCICLKQYFDTRYLVFYNTSPPRMFLSLDLLWEYRIQQGANGPLYVTSCYSTWIFCRGVSGFATDCPCDVWCRGLTTCLLHVGPPFGNRILNNSWAVGLT